MSNIEVGEYVRTKTGLIFKLGIIHEGQTCIVMDEKESIKNEKYRDIAEFYKDIKSHSKNIIDLIEVGDCVNGYLVTDIVIASPKMDGNHIYTVKCGKIGFAEKQIKTILTKEQFKEMEYRIDE